MTTGTTTTKTDPTEASESTRAAIGQALGDAAGTVRDVATSTADRVPEAASAARDLLVEADGRMRAGSDELLSAGATLSAGLAVGLLVGRANRLLVALAMVPAIAMGLTLLDRSSGRPATRHQPRA